MHGKRTGKRATQGNVLLHRYSSLIISYSFLHDQTGHKPFLRIQSGERYRVDFKLRYPHWTHCVQPMDGQPLTFAHREDYI